MITDFWRYKTLQEMSRNEWESLCDGCGKCCLHKLEDEDNGKILYTQVSCRYLDQNCRCREYSERLSLVADCIELTPQQQHIFHWLPETCAYRLLSEGKALASWHPLVSGDRQTIHTAGISVRGRVISEEHVHPDEIKDRVVHWVE